MSEHHGGNVTLKPIGEIAKYQRNLIPINIPKSFVIKPLFKSIASEESICSGVIAFRDFLYVFCDRLISDGDFFAKTPKNPKSIGDYPFLFNVVNLLVDIGYHSTLSTNGDSLLITKIPLCTPTVENGKTKAPRISISSFIECLRFLSLCGFSFKGIDIETKRPDISEISLEVLYPDKPNLPIGLKALSIADMELRESRRYWNDNNLLRCDYRLIKAEESDVLDVLKDFLHALPEATQEFCIKLHRRYTDSGLTCLNTRLGLVSFAYVILRKSKKTPSERDIYAKRIWEYSYSLKDGFCLFVRPKYTDKYTDLIKTFPISLQETIARSYGCDRKRGEPCQHGCQGIRISLDDTFCNISKFVEAWIDNEVLFNLCK